MSTLTPRIRYPSPLTSPNSFQSHSRAESTSPGSGSQFFSGASNFSVNEVKININDPSERERFDYAERVKQWLSATDSRSAQPDLGKRTAGTGTWFIDGSEYRRWMNGVRKALWVTGMPGAGKTMLSSIAVHDIKETCTSSNGAQAMAFFMCQYKTQPSTADILGSFLRQLYESNHSETSRLIESAFTECTSPSKVGPLPDDELLKLLHRCCALRQKVHIVVDALDELQKDVRDRLLRHLWPLEKVNILLTSRPNIGVPSLNGLSLTHGHGLERELIPLPIAERNQSDIELFVTTALRNTERLVQLLEGTRKSSSEIVAAKITQKAGGMFLLASLQVESLKPCITIKDLLSKIDQLPSGAEGLYKLTMERIEDQAEGEVSVAKRALLWVTYAQSFMTMEMLRTALAGVSKTEGVDVDDRPPESVILGCCCGLLVVDQSTRFVRLVHLTADEFIRNLKEPLFKSPHSFIARHCITYLSSCTSLEPDPAQLVDDDTDAVFNETSLSPQRVHFSYAYGNWAIHAKHALSEREWQGETFRMKDIVSSFVLGCKDYVCQITTASGWQRPIRTSSSTSSLPTPEIVHPVHLAALHGFTSILQSINTRKWDARTSTGSTPLHLAAYRGDKEIVDIILSDNPSRVNSVDDYSFTPLMLACQQGHTDIVSTLLSSSERVNMNARSKYHDATAIILATTWGRTSIVDLLLSHPCSTSTIDLQAQDDQGRTALMLACALGFEDIVSSFVRNTATAEPNLNINQSTAFGFTAFTEAALHGSVPIFQLLLSHPHQKFDPSNDTALFRAVKFGREEMVQYLLTLECIDVNVRASAGATPLVAAAQDRQEGMCRLLLNHPSIDVNITDNKGYTPLLYAAESGQTWLVELLLQRKDVKVNASTNSNGSPLRGRKTALMLACMEGHHDVVDRLLAHRGVDVNAKDDKRQTALTLAGGANRKLIIGSLLRSMQIR